MVVLPNDAEDEFEAALLVETNSPQILLMHMQHEPCRTTGRNSQFLSFANQVAHDLF